MGEGEEENEKKKRQKRSIHGDVVIMVVMNDEKEWVLRERERERNYGMMILDYYEDFVIKGGGIRRRIRAKGNYAV